MQAYVGKNAFRIAFSYIAAQLAQRHAARLGDKNRSVVNDEYMADESQASVDLPIFSWKYHGDIVSILGQKSSIHQHWGLI